jgi:hypothetical protein
LPPQAIAAGGGRRPGKDYLLSPMRKADLTVLDEVLDRVATATRRILSEGPAAAMNEFNRKEDRDQGTGNREQKTLLWHSAGGVVDELLTVHCPRTTVHGARTTAN